MNTWKPVRLSTITQQTIGDETLLLDAKGGTVHVLNTTAQAIWRLCDGEHTQAAIVSELREQFELPSADTVEQDVRHTLNQFLDKGLLS